MAEIELDWDDAEATIRHLLVEHDLEHDAEWTATALREAGGPAESDLHAWYHWNKDEEPNHSHGVEYTKWVNEVWHL